MTSEQQSNPTESAGILRIERAFEAVLSRQAAALMPYFTLGYPDEPTSMTIIEAIASYSDILELGLPFSDPIADGPTIQRTTQVSLANGTSLNNCLQMLARLRNRGVETPSLLMGYFNPILAYGLAEFVKDAGRAGADGLIIPDLPVDEDHELSELLTRSGLALIRFVSPTTKLRRVDEIVAKARGFVYAISVTGVTGARASLDAEIARLTTAVKEASATPVAVGFGISSPVQAASVARYADGVIVGSALIDAVDSVSRNKQGAAISLVGALRQALQMD